MQLSLAKPTMDRFNDGQRDFVVIHDATKTRIAETLLGEMTTPHVVYPGGVTGDSALALVQSCTRHHKKVTLVFNAQEMTAANAHLLAIYRDAGASIETFSGSEQDGWNKAHQIAAQHDARVISFADEAAVDVIRHSVTRALAENSAVKALPPIQHAFVAAARGGFCRGLEQAINTFNHDKYGTTPAVQMHIVRIVNLGYDFGNAAKVYDAPFPLPHATPTFPCNAEYELQAWRVMMHASKENNLSGDGTVLLLNGSAPARFLA